MNDLTKPLEDLQRRLVSPVVTQQGAKAMADVMRKATASAIGPDLRLSHFRGGPVQIEAKGTIGVATTTISGAAYALADKGRRRARRRIYPRGHALATPFGPRASVKGSTARGHNITERASPQAYEAGKKAILDAVKRTA